jgi:hypothetical protein
MEPRTEDQESSIHTGNRERWSQVLSEVEGERNTGNPWWKNAGIFLAWAAGFAAAAGIIVVVFVLIVSLLSPGMAFSARTVSDWMFWAAALLMVFGLLSPSAADAEKQVSSRRQGRRNSSQRRTSGAQRSASGVQRRASATQRQSSTQRASSDQNQAQEQQSQPDRMSESLRRRLRRVYDPWRWRLWGGALLTFGLSMLAGLFAHAPG